MKYEDSFCSLEALIESDAFTVERHGLRIAQPITVYDDWTNDIDGVVDGIHLECRIPGLGSRFGRIDFSKGFSQWWYLSHIDIHVPSEHTQEGKRYDAEIQLYREFVLHELLSSSLRFYRADSFFLPNDRFLQRFKGSNRNRHGK